MRQKHLLRILRRLFYPLAAAFDLWILHITLAAVDIAVPPRSWFCGWGAFYGTLLLAPWIAQSAFGQLLGRIMTYAYAVHAVFLWAAAGSFSLLLTLPHWYADGRHAAGRLGLVLFFIAALCCLGGFCKARRLSVHRFTLTASKVLPAARLRLVHLSDLHFGFVQNARFAAKLVRKVNALYPDLICITGDFFSDTLRPIASPDAIAAVLSEMRTKYGVFACLGNHDVGGQEEMEAFFQRANIRILADEAQFPTPNIAIIGRTDASPGGVRIRRPSVGECMVGTDPLQYRIVLDHQPGEIEEAAQAGADLLLCGHTHGGQFFPIRQFIQRRFQYCAGLYRYRHLTVAVSPGSGAGAPPIRLGSRGEIFLLTVNEWDTAVKASSPDTLKKG